MVPINFGLKVNPYEPDRDQMFVGIRSSLDNLTLYAVGFNSYIYRLSQQRYFQYKYVEE